MKKLVQLFNLVYKQSLFKLVKKGSDLDIVSIDIICDFNATEDTSLNQIQFYEIGSTLDITSE